MEAFSLEKSKKHETQPSSVVVLHVERAGWVAAVWSGDHFHDNHDHYPLDDVECVFELPTGSLCEHCNIPMAVCKLADPVILRCLSCGRYG